MSTVTGPANQDRVIITTSNIIKARHRSAFVGWSGDLAVVFRQMKEQGFLLGYDARDWLGSEVAWSQSRRRRFLLRRDIKKPLSVDSDVWSSVFDRVLGLKRPEWTGYVQDLWADLTVLTMAVQSEGVPAGVSTRLIAIDLVKATCSEEQLIAWRDRVPAVLPPDLATISHKLAGYDVADYFLLSGLMNCEVHPPHDVSRWLPLLNQHHLFKNIESATEFKTVIEERVPEHAPFFVFALWLLEP